MTELNFDCVVCSVCGMAMSSQVLGEHDLVHRLESSLAEEQARGRRYRESLRAIRLMVDVQAEDEGLWSIPVEGLQSIVEAYLQQELRRLHECVEHYIKAALADEGGAQ